MDIVMTGADFELLTDTSMAWGDMWRAHDGRFELVGEGRQHDGQPAWDWCMAYWLGDNPVAVILAKSFLVGDCEVLWDLSLQSYVVLTNYRSPGWQRADLVDKGE